MTTTDISPVASFTLRAQEVTAALSRADEAYDDAKRRRAALMADMRHEGYTWAEVGKVLGVSQQRASRLGHTYGID